MITWSRNPHAKTPIPGKPSKSGLKDNMFAPFIGFSWKSLLAHMHPNPIAGLKDNMFAPLIGFGRIHTFLLCNLLPHTLMECLHHLCFTITIQTNPFQQAKESNPLELKG